MLLTIAVGPGQAEAGAAKVASATAGYLYVASNGIQVLAQDIGGHLKVVSHAAGGAAIGMAMTHERNGLNLFALAPDGPGELYGVYHYVVNQKTGALTAKGGPVGSYHAASLPDDLVAYDGRGIDGHSSSALFLADDTSYVQPVHARIDSLAINASTGAVTPDGATTITDTSGALTMALGGRNLDLVVGHLDPGATEVQEGIVVGTINPSTGKLGGLENFYGLTIAGSKAVCGCAPLAAAARPGEMAINGDVGAEPHGERSYGVGVFAVSAGGTSQHGYGPNNMRYGIDGTPITYAGGRVVTTSSDASFSSTSIELFAPSNAVETGALTVDATGGYATALLALGNYLYVDMTGALAQLRISSGGADISPLAPETLPIGGAVAMTGFLLSPAKATITKHPAATVKATSTTATVTFDFIANEHVTFRCRLDTTTYTACTSPTSYKVKPGTHGFSVEATDDSGITGAASSFTFRVVNG